MSPRIAGIGLQISDLQMFNAEITHLRLLVCGGPYIRQSTRYLNRTLMLSDLRAQTIIVMLNSATIRSLASLSISERGGCIVLGVLRIVSTPIELYRKSIIFRAKDR